MRISLLHPSRGRAKKASETANYWRNKASGTIDIEYILSIDNSDHENKAYIAYASEIFNSNYIISNPNNCVVQATNQAAKKATGDVLIYMSDDIFPEQNWDKMIADVLHDKLKLTCLLKVDDMLQPFWKDVVTAPIMTKVLHDTLGYFFHPEYLSMWVDCDLYHVCKNKGWIIEAPEIKFEHKHYSVGKSIKDETYTRSDNNWSQGLDIYNKRKKQNFPI